MQIFKLIQTIEWQLKKIKTLRLVGEPEGNIEISFVTSVETAKKMIEELNALKQERDTNTSE